MPQELVDNDTFLTRLDAAFKQSSAADTRTGTVWLTHKRYTYVDPTAGNADVDMDGGNAGEGSSDGKEYDVLIRCTNGDDVNFATRIPPSSLPTFHSHYGSLLKASLAPHMLKRDKKKEKLRSEARDKWRKKVVEEDVEVGSRRVVASGSGGSAGAGAGVGGGESGGGVGKKLGHRQRKRKLVAQRKRESQREALLEREGKEGVIAAGAGGGT